VIVVKVDSAQSKMLNSLKEVMVGTPVDLNDAVLHQLCDTNSIQKIYRLDQFTQNLGGLPHLSKSCISAMAMRNTI